MIMAQKNEIQVYENAVIVATPLPQLENWEEPSDNKDNSNWGNAVALIGEFMLRNISSICQTRICCRQK